jgi:lysophospholipase L1-like esterase
MSQHYNTYLALGDSYTIGESLPLHDSFPYQLVQLFRQKGLHFHAPEIVAQTGWTTGELATHLLHTRLNEQYDYVTLLIGVNNQYRSYSTADYKEDFVFLLNKALHFAGERPERVIVLSIPDWGVTPFATDRDREKIAQEIDAFNAINRTVSQQKGVQYVDITPGTREAAHEKSLLAADGLHYSAAEHGRWASLVATCIVNTHG